jgi:hypothetical protein
MGVVNSTGLRRRRPAAGAVTVAIIATFILISATEHSCRIHNAEFQRYYRTSECSKSGNTQTNWWFQYWPT